MFDTSSYSPSANRMWCAYVLAPAVAPFAFVAWFFIAGIFLTTVGFNVNSASAAVLPTVAFKWGLPAAYVVAGMIGMPIAFALRSIGKLNLFTIHVAAIGWALIFSALFSVWMSNGNLWLIPLISTYVFLGVAPPIALSGTAFWLLTRLAPRSSVPPAE